jgi:hypothetical protein
VQGLCGSSGGRDKHLVGGQRGQSQVRKGCRRRDAEEPAEQCSQLKRTSRGNRTRTRSECIGERKKLCN